MNRYDTFISDVDGTLIPFNSDLLPTDAVTDAVRKATARGVIFTIATGRPYSDVSHIIRHLGICHPFITDNGAVIQSGTGSVLWETNLDYPRIRGIIRDAERGWERISASTDTGWYENPEDIPKNAKIRKIILRNTDTSESMAIVRRVEEHHKDLTLVPEPIPTNPARTDIYIADEAATKQHAIVKLMQIMNIQAERAVGIGDGINDFPLLMACGFKIAMGNAREDLKAIADFVVPSLDEDGVACALEHFSV